MNMYRGITINNSISKLFTSLMNTRLTVLVERAGWLGQIQNGFRKNRQGNDSLMILRTIMEKSKQVGKKGDRNLSLLFVDLQKAYDMVPHELLWAKLDSLGLGDKFVNILKALYKDDCFKIRINGLYTGAVHPQRGLKQGCPLSPILFGLFMADLGRTLENSNLGVKIFGQTISGLLFADDLVLIAKTMEGVKHLRGVCQQYFEEHGLKINCDKSNILTLGEEHPPPPSTYGPPMEKTLGASTKQ
jgi:hypothetical protein